MKFDPNDIAEIFDEAQGGAHLDFEQLGLNVFDANDAHGNIENLRRWKAETPPALMKLYRRRQHAKPADKAARAAYKPSWNAANPDRVKAHDRANYLKKKAKKVKP